MSRALPAELLRYIINGLAATAVHYVVLALALEWLNLRPAWMANLIAAIFGILASFWGSRHFVFRQVQEPSRHQLRRFVLLYGMIALLHALVMGALTDGLGVDYRASFVFATALQTLLSYLGNKLLVFRT